MMSKTKRKTRKAIKARENCEEESEVFALQHEDNDEEDKKVYTAEYLPDVNRQIQAFLMHCVHMICCK